MSISMLRPLPTQSPSTRLRSSASSQRKSLVSSARRQLTVTAGRDENEEAQSWTAKLSGAALPVMLSISLAATAIGAIPVALIELRFGLVLALQLGPEPAEAARSAARAGGRGGFAARGSSSSTRTSAAPRDSVATAPPPASTNTVIRETNTVVVVQPPPPPLFPIIPIVPIVPIVPFGMGGGGGGATQAELQREREVDLKQAEDIGALKAKTEGEQIQIEDLKRQIAEIQAAK
ncbi:hypothetical protein CYMTET_20012 [Cymbomonas tetramitiformis]|uniref:Uncharacterized protein n=1 Tax=Cymbomonas tetramitiformis TaxID=36881 RepID=A0AAE0L4Q9_9CHLO|nr:hypothetical protein CYMTET_20012 [Cymbomonas tetramitiformis]